MKGMGQFNPDFYQQYRPYYPIELFARLEKALEEKGCSAPFSVADIGCGTGHSTLSFLRTGIPARVIGVDPDPGMLERARENAASFEFASGQSLSFQEGTGERTGLPDRSMDLLLVGSAFHWMDPVLARDEFHRISKPGGLIRIFEYQFPKAMGHSELNEWIRRQFNLYWKAPGQVPRGRLLELTQGFRGPFEFLSNQKVAMTLELNLEELAGLIFSQSRVLHYEAKLKGEGEIKAFRDSVKTELRQKMKSEKESFDFKLSFLDFRSQE